MQTSAATRQAISLHRKVVFRCSVPAGIGWVVFQMSLEILLGPHISLIRSLAIGSGLGALVGLTMAAVQWFALRSYTREAGLWIPATTVGCTAAGTIGSFLLYQAIAHTPFYTSIVPVQGFALSALVGVLIASCQWAALKGWARPGTVVRWLVAIGLGTSLAAPAAWLVGQGGSGLLAWLLGRSAWSVVIASGYLVGGIAGGVVFGVFNAWGLRRVLPDPAEVEVHAIDSFPARAALSS